MSITFRRPSPALILATAAIVAGGAGSATAASLITGKQIKNDTVASADIKNGSLTSSDIKKGSISVTRLAASAKKAMVGTPGPQGPAGATGATGAAGQPGAQGVQGEKGDRGPSDGYATFEGNPGAAPNAKATIDTLDLPRGSFIIMAKVDATADGAGDILECDLVNQGDVIGRSRIVASGVGRQILTVQAAPTLNGLLLNSNDVQFQCADNDSDVTLGHAAMTAVRVGEMHEG